MIMTCGPLIGFVVIEQWKASSGFVKEADCCSKMKWYVFEIVERKEERERKR
jgi:hypothetical protein